MEERTIRKGEVRTDELYSGRMYVWNYTDTKYSKEEDHKRRNIRTRNDSRPVATITPLP